MAKTITHLYHSEIKTEKAIAFFEAAFSNKDIPADIPELQIQGGMTIQEIISELVEMGRRKSKSEFLRLIKQNGHPIK